MTVRGTAAVNNQCSEQGSGFAVSNANAALRLAHLVATGNLFAGQSGPPAIAETYGDSNLRGNYFAIDKGSLTPVTNQ